MKSRANPELIDLDDIATPTPLTSFILDGLERLEWEMERIELTLRAEVLRREDRNTISKSFDKISRECELLRKWLRAAPIEELRN